MIFVTEDKWMRKRGKLDKVDEEILKQASQDGELTIMNLSEMLDYMQQNEPEKFNKMTEPYQGLITVTKEELTKLARQGDARYAEFKFMFMGMSHDQARQIRHWRVDKHYSWRSIARAAFMRVRSGGWQNFQTWQEPSNQIAGVCLCEKAAKIMGENDRNDPWN